MKDADIDPRQKAILESAWQAFATYGFRKTSMDDIARGARISRPAVYLYYKNKEAIFRSLVELHYASKTAAVREALNGSRSVAETMAAAMAAQGEGMEALLNSPHGLELLDAGTSTAPDIVQEGEARLSALYANWLQRMAEAGVVHLNADASDVAATITSALKGIKSTAPDYRVFVARVDQLAGLIGAGLEVR